LELPERQLRLPGRLRRDEAIEETVDRQILDEPIDRARDASIVGRQELHHRDEQERRVEGVRLVALAETSELLRPSALEHLIEDALPRLAPLRDGRGGRVVRFFADS